MQWTKRIKALFMLTVFVAVPLASQNHEATLARTESAEVAGTSYEILKVKNRSRALDSLSPGGQRYFYIDDQTLRQAEDSQSLEQLNPEVIVTLGLRGISTAVVTRGHHRIRTSAGEESSRIGVTRLGQKPGLASQPIEVDSLINVQKLEVLSTGGGRLLLRRLRSADSKSFITNFD